MRILLRHITSVLLLIVVVFASTELAAARGQAPAAGTLVICTGSGPIHILVDKNGEPTGRVMICPDYALAFYADAAPQTPKALRIDVWHALWQARALRLGFAQAAPQSHARGPPIPV
ncbi:MAG TPA: hypothetical protein VJ928_02945 [Marivita sp.]|nr:hypothetical protein [Marivita sp.]